MKKLFTVLALLPVMSLANANILKNGTFDEVDHGNTFGFMFKDNETIAPWKVVDGNVDLIGTYWQPNDGRYSIDLVGGNTVSGSIAQTFKTNKGKMYLVEFYMSANPVGGAAVKTIDVSVSDSDTSTLSFDYNSTGNTLKTMNWVKKSFTFTAQSNEATITFTGYIKGVNYPHNYGPALDSVSIIQIDDDGSNIICD